MKPVSELYPSLKEGIRDPAKIIEEINEVGEEWSNLNAAATLLEDTKKSILAKIQLEYEEGFGAARGSKTKAEAYALSDERYLSHLKEASEARRMANIARVRYDQGKMYIELQRSIAATLRQQMQMLNIPT